MGRPKLHPMLQMGSNQSFIKLQHDLLTLVLYALTSEGQHTNLLPLPLYLFVLLLSGSYGLGLQDVSVHYF